MKKIKKNLTFFCIRRIIVKKGCIYMYCRKNTKISALAAVLLLALVFASAFICGCAQNEGNARPNYDDILNEAAYEQAKPTAEVITGTVSFVQNNEKDEKTEKIEKTEPAEPTATITEITEITAAAEEAEEVEKVEETEEPVLFVVTQSGKKYHLPSCYMVKSIKQYMTKEEAEQSKYEPCKICNPH